MPYTTSDMMIGEMEECIRTCLSCKKTVLETITYCLQMGGRCAAAAQISTLIDVTDICQTSADFMMRSSDLHGWICGVCAEVCKEAARKLEAFKDNQEMQECHQALIACTESCRHMAGMAVHRA